MKIFEYIKAGFWLVLVIIAAVFGLSHSFYGLMVNIQNSSIYNIELAAIENENLKKNRYLNVIDANSYTDPLTYLDENGQPMKYIYALTPLSYVGESNKVQPTSKIVLESKRPIEDWKSANIRGLLKPYWFSVDQDIISNFEYLGVKVSDDVEYLELNKEPWKWYWHILIILLALLFFFRMFEAVYNKIKKSNSEEKKEI